MSVENEFQDIIATHQAYLQFYANGFIRRLQAEIKKLERNLRSDLSYYDDIYDNKTLLRTSVKESLKEFQDNTTSIINNEVSRLSSIETNFYADQLNNIFDGTGLNVSNLSESEADEYVRKQKYNFENGEVLTFLGFLLKFFNDTKNRVLQQIESSYMLDDSPTVMKEKLVGVNGQSRISANRIATIAATLVTFVSSKIRERNYEINQDKIIGYQWVSVIDSRTSSFCRWADGKTYFYDSEGGSLGGPYEPPIHNNCRSSTTPIFKKWDDLGLDSSYSDVFTGEPPQRTTYYEWLERQPTTIQKDVLGNTRYDLWKNENISPDRFYNSSGKYLTLDQLQEKNIKIPKEYLRYVRGT